MPCYDFTLIAGFTFSAGEADSGTPNSLGVTGGEYKTRERIQRAVADTRLLAIPAS